MQIWHALVVASVVSYQGSVQIESCGGYPGIMDSDLPARATQVRNQRRPAGAHQVVRVLDQTTLEEPIQGCSPSRAPIPDFSPESKFCHRGERYDHAVADQMTRVARAANGIILQDVGDHV